MGVRAQPYQNRGLSYLIWGWGYLAVLGVSPGRAEPVQRSHACGVRCAYLILLAPYCTSVPVCIAPYGTSVPECISHPGSTIPCVSTGVLISSQ
eukprot:2006830-Rhodomonas_salina.1